MLCSWVVIGHGADLLTKALAFRSGLAGLRRLSLGYYGMVLAHGGLVMLVAGVTLVSFLDIERDLRMAPGDVAQVAGYDFLFERMDDYRGPNFTSERGHFLVTRDGRHVATLTPEKRTYLASRQVMTEAALDPGFWRDLYVALGEPLGDGAWAVRIYYKPGVRWLWLGALIMALGGVLAILDRRYRRGSTAAENHDVA